MERILVVLLLGIAAVFWNLACAEELSSDLESFLTTDNLAKLEKDQIITVKKGSKDATGKSLGQGRAVALIRKPASDVWGQLTRHEDHPSFMPHLMKTERYQQTGQEVGIQETIKILFSTMRYHVLLNEDQPKLTISWKLDKTKPNDIKDTAGSWQIKPQGDNACIVLYSVSVDSGLSFPKPVENFFFNQDLPGIIESLKKHMETGYIK